MKTKKVKVNTQILTWNSVSLARNILALILISLFESNSSFASLTEFNYIIHQTNGVCYAQNGETGGDDYSNSDVGAVINSAIGALSTNGGSIAISRGVYNVATTINLNNSITICGHSGSILKKTFNGVLIEGQGVENIKLEGFEINGNKSQCSGAGIWLISGSQHVTISDLYVHDCNLDGIIFGDSTTSYNRVTGCRVENCEGGGITMGSSATESIISENYIYRTRNHGIGITHGGSHCQIVNNKIVEAGYFRGEGDFCHGIAVDGGSGNNPGYGNVISGNIIIHPYMAGIEVADTQNFCIIANNMVEDANSYGIYFGGGLAPSFNSTITGNIVKHTTDSGIRIGAPAGGGTVNVTVGNNFVSDNDRDGIEIDSVGSCNISGNICFNNDENGIDISGDSSQSIAYRMNVFGNMCYDNRTTPQQAYGLYLQNLSYITVLGNAFSPNATGDIYQSNVTNLILEHNQ